MDRERFIWARNVIAGAEKTRSGIGTLGEKTLHAVLKLYFEPDKAKHEVVVKSAAVGADKHRFVADIFAESGIIEIQTRNFNALRDKLKVFLSENDVTVVYPIAVKKWLCSIDPETGEITKKRKSPKAGTVFDAFPELYKIKPLLCNERLHIRFVLLEITEYRLLNGQSARSRKGCTCLERVPNDIFDEVTVGAADGFSSLMLHELPCEFTAKEFAHAAKISVRNAQIAMNVLAFVGETKKVGKRGNAIVYTKK